MTKGRRAMRLGAPSGITGWEDVAAAVTEARVVLPEEM